MVVCSICGQRFANKSNLNRHVKRFHQKRVYLEEERVDCEEGGDESCSTPALVEEMDSREVGHELRERARDEITILTVRNFKNHDACLAAQYQTLHNDAEQILLTLPSVSNNAEAHENISRMLRSMLKPSIEHLERILNLEMLRIVTELHKMIN